MNPVTQRQQGCIARPPHHQSYPWIVIICCALFLFYKYILQISPSVMTDQLMAHFHIKGLGLGNLAATYFYTYLVVQLFVGPLLDKYNPRTLTALAIAICAAGAWVFADADTLTIATLGRAIIGVGAAFATVSYFKMTALWFEAKYFALVGGLLATAAMIGSIAGQIPMAYLVDAEGWQHSLFICSLLGFAIALLFYTCVRNKPQEKTATTLKTFKLRDLATLLKQKHNWILTFYSGLAFAPIAVFGGLWGNSFLQVAYHVTKPTAASLTSMLFLGLAIGSPVLGWLSDRLHKRLSVMFWGLVVSLCSLIAALYISDLPLWLEGLLLFLFGFGTGAFMIGFTIGKELNPVIFAASIVGLINTGDAIFGAFSEPLAGKLLDICSHGHMANGAPVFSVADYHVALAILPIYLFIAILLVLTLKRNHETMKL
jgi:MFS family permease